MNGVSALTSGGMRSAGDGPRLLVVAVANSVHTGSYLRLLENTGWQIELFDAQHGGPPHPDIPAVRIHTAWAHEQKPEYEFTVVPPASGSTAGFTDRAAELSGLIDEFEPDIIHSHEIQHAGALVDLARRHRGGALPAPWLQTSWGSDVFMYSRHPNYVDRIRSVVTGADYFGAECHRDVALARALGFGGRAVGVWPVVGGIDIERVRGLSRPGPASGRRTIAVKGVAGAIARGDRALAALELLGKRLEGFEVCTYQTTPELEPRFREAVERGGGEYRCLSKATAASVPHDEILAMHGRSRVSLALNDSDGMSTSFMEAMAAGSFPVHSSTSCGYEVTPPGRGTLVVPPRDPEAVAAAVGRALEDDDLVDRAQVINRRASAEHFDRERVRARILDMYDRIFDQAAMEALR